MSVKLNINEMSQSTNSSGANNNIKYNNSLDKDGHSTLLSIPLIPKVVAAVFPAIIPQENSLLYNVCYECSETLGNKGMTCVQCKESFHVKCHVLPKNGNVLDVSHLNLNKYF